MKGMFLIVFAILAMAFCTVDAAAIASGFLSSRSTWLHSFTDQLSVFQLRTQLMTFKKYAAHMAQAGKARFKAFVSWAHARESVSSSHHRRCFTAAA